MQSQRATPSAACELGLQPVTGPLDMYVCRRSWTPRRRACCRARTAPRALRPRRSRQPPRHETRGHRRPKSPRPCRQACGPDTADVWLRSNSSTCRWLPLAAPAHAVCPQSQAQNSLKPSSPGVRDPTGGLCTGPDWAWSPSLGPQCICPGCLTIVGMAGKHQHSGAVSWDSIS